MILLLYLSYLFILCTVNPDPMQDKHLEYHILCSLLCVRIAIKSEAENDVSVEEAREAR